MPTYAAAEALGGEPIELYRFVAGGTVFTYTSSDAPVTFDAGFGAETYQPSLIKRDKSETSAESTKVDYKIGLGITTTLAQQFVNGVAASTVTCAVYRYQRGADLSHGVDGVNVINPFSGVVASCARQGAEATIVATPPQRTIQQTIPRFRLQVLCNHDLYSTDCGVVKATFTVAGTVASMSADGRTLGVTVPLLPATPPPYFSGGIIAFGNYSGFIETHVSTVSTLATFVLLLAVPTLVVGSSVNVSAGCDRTYGTCKAKFSNGPHHFGFPYINITDPWAWGVPLAIPK